MPSPDPDPAAVESLLAQTGSGNPDASAQLFDLLYGELRQRAHAILRDGGLTLQPTALVHEAWLKLVPGKQQRPRDRTHFMRLAAAAMRSVLVDHVRARNADKRGGDRKRVLLDGICDAFEDRAYDIVALDDALQRLHHLDAQLARVVELRFFAGLEVADVAAAMDISTSTVERAWRTARTWLHQELSPP